MRVRLVQIDGKLPNLALMRLSAWHKAQGDSVTFTRSVSPDLFDESADRVYASCIFSFSKPKLDTFRRNYPDAIIGGTGSGDLKISTEHFISGDSLDYSIYPDYKFSLGFSQRGCRLKCGFCLVPKIEGAQNTFKPIESIWRGPGHAKKICLLDNDFFGQPRDEWREKVKELNDGGFKVCFNQGLNVRLLDEEACAALATVQYRDDQFQQRRLYTAWDNINDEGIFFRGVDMLEKAGIPPKHLMAYMLVGYDSKETWERIWTRFNRMVERGIMPYPMVYDSTRKDLKHFQRWVVTGLYRAVKWEDYRHGNAPPRAAGERNK